MGTPDTVQLQTSMQDSTVFVNGNDKAVDLSPVNLMCPELEPPQGFGDMHRQPHHAK